MKRNNLQRAAVIGAVTFLCGALGWSAGAWAQAQPGDQGPKRAPRARQPVPPGEPRAVEDGEPRAVEDGEPQPPAQADEGNQPARRGQGRGAMGPGGMRGPRGQGAGGPPEGVGPEGPRARGMWQRLSEEDQEDVLRFVEQYFPELNEELQKLRDEQPWLYERRIRRVAPEMLELMELMEADPQRGRLAVRERVLDLKLRQLLHRYRQTADETKLEELRIQIREVLTRKVDCRLERYELEIRDLQRRIDDVRGQLEKAQTRRETLIDEMLQRSLTEPVPPADRPGPRGRGAWDPLGDEERPPEPVPPAAPHGEAHPPVLPNP